MKLILVVFLLVVAYRFIFIPLLLKITNPSDQNILADLTACSLLLKRNSFISTEQFENYDIDNKELYERSISVFLACLFCLYMTKQYRIRRDVKLQKRILNIVGQRFTYAYELLENANNYISDRVRDRKIKSDDDCYFYLAFWSMGELFGHLYETSLSTSEYELLHNTIQCRLKQSNVL